jgi:hypothetical protein
LAVKSAGVSGDPRGEMASLAIKSGHDERETHFQVAREAREDNVMTPTGVSEAPASETPV